MDSEFVAISMRLNDQHSLYERGYRRGFYDLKLCNYVCSLIYEDLQWWNHSIGQVSADRAVGTWR